MKTFINILAIALLLILVASVIKLSIFLPGGAIPYLIVIVVVLGACTYIYKNDKI